MSVMNSVIQISDGGPCPFVREAFVWFGAKLIKCHIEGADFIGSSVEVKTVDNDRAGRDFKGSVVFKDRYDPECDYVLVDQE